MALIATVAMIFCSCNKQAEDVYFPKQKLVSVITDQGDGDIMSYIFQYDGKFIKQVTIDGVLCDVVYDGKQIAEVHNENETAVVRFTYQDKKVVRIDYIEDNEESMYMVFTRGNDGKIAKIQTYLNEDDSYDWMKRCQNPLVRSIFNTEAIEMMLKQANKGNFSMQMEENWTYEGNNVVTSTIEMEYNGMVGALKTTYSYDDNNNPYYGLPYPLGMTASYSKNNILSSKQSLVYMGVNLSSENCNYVYTYDAKHYPLTCVVTDDDGDIESSTVFTY